jgi:hypothetical protein
MIPHHIRLEAIREAKIFYGMDVTETPTASNSGFFIDQMIRRFGGSPGWAWCMYFVQECVWLAHHTYFQKSPLVFRADDGEVDLTKPHGHCYSVWHHALDSDELGIILAADIMNGERVPEGSIYIRYGSDHTGHTGIVVSHNQDFDNHDRDIIKTIEGNASNAVSLRKYTLASMMGNDLKGVIH